MLLVWFLGCSSGLQVSHLTSPLASTQTRICDCLVRTPPL